jgi:hypothetical protein
VKNKAGIFQQQREEEQEKKSRELPLLFGDRMFHSLNY